MDLIHTGVELEIGSVIEAVGPPSANWKCADGQILNLADYPQYVASCNNLHPKSYEGIQYLNERTEPPYACARMGNIIVVVGKGTEVLYTTDGGQSWTVNNPLGGSSSDYYYGVACDGTTFVTCRYNSNAAYTSTDGINWTPRTMSQTRYWTDLVWTGNYFMAIDFVNDDIDYSANGTSGWTGATFPDSASDVDNAAYGGNAYIYYNYDDYKWHKTIDGGQNWSTSTDVMGWLSPAYEGIAPSYVGYDGTDFVIWFNYVDASWFVKSSDGLVWDEWIPFTQDIYGYYDFSPNLVHYDGSNDIFVMQGYSQSYPSWFVCDGKLENYNRRISQVVYDIPYNQSKNKLAVIPGTGMMLLGYDGVKNRELWADYTRYDSTVQFQLPALSNGLPGGVQKYIRMA
jgi:hypothetical protein